MEKIMNIMAILSWYGYFIMYLLSDSLSCS